jgi:hypothetical protein
MSDWNPSEIIGNNPNLLDYSTIYTSVLRNIDPSPVEPIDFIKKQLERD